MAKIRVLALENIRAVPLTVYASCRQPSSTCRTTTPTYS
jgi:hypothetical protein